MSGAKSRATPKARRTVTAAHKHRPIPSGRAVLRRRPDVAPSSVAAVYDRRPDTGELSIKNLQRTRPINLKLLREIVRHLLELNLAQKDYDITVVLLGAASMTRLNESSLQHKGSTDVITFDFSGAPPLPRLAGEINVCVDEALLQSRTFGTAWQSELVRYIAHGILHLRGHEDHKAAARRLMKREENSLVRKLSREFDLSKLSSKTRVRA